MGLTRLLSRSASFSSSSGLSFPSFPNAVFSVSEAQLSKPDLLYSCESTMMSSLSIHCVRSFSLRASGLVSED